MNFLLPFFKKWHIFFENLFSHSCVGEVAKEDQICEDLLEKAVEINGLITTGKVCNFHYVTTS